MNAYSRHYEVSELADKIKVMEDMVKRKKDQIDMFIELDEDEDDGELFSKENRKH